MSISLNYKENLNRIIELAAYFRNFNESIVDETKNTITYEGLSNEHIISKDLMHRPEVAVACIEMKPGYTFQWHDHPGEEIVIIFEGDIMFMSESRGEIISGVGDLVKFAPKEKHSNTTINGCKLIAVTIPSSKDYPLANGDNNG